MNRAAAPFHVMVKPIGPVCNLACRYCFYLEKENLFPGGEHWRMSGEVLEEFIRQYIEAQPVETVSFAWQGGEPTLLGVDFFRNVVALQKKYAQGRPVENAFQTNGVLLDDEWGEFLRENAFLIGLSLDGPRNLHDEFRVDKKGEGTHSRVMRGLEVLLKHKVEFNTLTCLHRRNTKKPLDVYRFLRGAGARHMQFIPIIERKPGADARGLNLHLSTPPVLDPDEKNDAPGPPVTSWSVRPEDFGDFYIQVFGRWVRKDVGRCFIQLFDTTLGHWLGTPGGVCVQAETCGRALVMEHDGNVYACDHFVYPRYHLGNILKQHIAEMAESPAQMKFGADKRGALPRFCRGCGVRFACNGGCPKHRFRKTPDGEKGLNYLCAGYKKFFEYARPYMGVMAHLYQNGRPPAEIMEILAKKQIPGLK